MSEVIEQYIRTHPGMRESDAFEGFLQQDRIRAWVGTDESRRERLRREFSRVWSVLQPENAPSLGPGHPGAGQIQAPPQRAPPPARPEPKVPMRVDVQAAPAAPPRRLQLLCSTCGKLTVWSENGLIACRNCGRRYVDLLELVPVKPVGPFAYVFGEGVEGWLTAGGVVLILLLAYGVMKWV